MKKQLKKLLGHHCENAKSLGYIVNDRAKRGIGTYLTWKDKLLLLVFDEEIDEYIRTASERQERKEQQGGIRTNCL